MESETDKQREYRQTDEQIESEIHEQTEYRQRDRHLDGDVSTDIRLERQTDRQSYLQTKDRQAQK